MSEYKVWPYSGKASGSGAEHHLAISDARGGDAVWSTDGGVRSAQGAVLAPSDEGPVTVAPARPENFSRFEAI